MKQINDGDLIILKSGGPVMTVVSVSTRDVTRGIITAIWFDAQGKIYEHKFPRHTVVLKHIDPSGW